MHAAFIHSGPLADIDPRPPRLFILLLGVLQGALMLLALPGGIDTWLLDGIEKRVPCITLATLLPLAMMLTVRRVGEIRFWLQNTLLALLLTGPAIWAGWSISVAPGLNIWPVLLPFGLSMLLVTLIVLPYFQAALRHGRWQPHYPDLFEFAWQNTLSLLLTAGFVGLCWGVLALGWQLLEIIGITALWHKASLPHFIHHPVFLHLMTGLLVGTGIAITRGQSRPVQAMRQIIFALLTALLPPLATLCLLVVGKLLVSGPQPLWQTGHATLILLGLLSLMTLVINGVFQDTRQAMRYVRPVRWMIYAALITLPALAALALYALWLRIQQYGWTQDRIAAVVVAALLGLHALGHALGALMPGRERLAAMKPVNIATSAITMMALLLLNSPLLDPHRITAHSQLARLAAPSTDDTDIDLTRLRFNSGRQGWLALKHFHQTLADGASALPSTHEQALAPFPRPSPAPAGASSSASTQSSRAGPPALAPTTTQQALTGAITRGDSTTLGDRLKVLLDSQSMAEARALEEDGTLTDDADQLARQIRLAPGTRPAEAAWWQALIAQQNNPADCQWQGNECVLIERDLDQDGRPERLLCNITAHRWNVHCEVFHKPRRPDPKRGADLAGWQQDGTLGYADTPDQLDGIRQALRQGQLKARPARWPDIDIGGVRMQIQE